MVDQTTHNFGGSVAISDLCENMAVFLDELGEAEYESHRTGRGTTVTTLEFRHEDPVVAESAKGVFHELGFETTGKVLKHGDRTYMARARAEYAEPR